MNEILDAETEQIKSSRFSKLSLLMAIISISLIAYFISSMPTTVKADQSLEPPHWSNNAFVIASVALGLIFSILSISRKEQWKYFKAIRNTINIFLAIFIIILLSKVILLVN